MRVTAPAWLGLSHRLAQSRTTCNRRVRLDSCGRWSFERALSIQAVERRLVEKWLASLVKFAPGIEAKFCREELVDITPHNLGRSLMQRESPRRLSSASSKVANVR